MLKQLSSINIHWIKGPVASSVYEIYGWPVTGHWPPKFTTWFQPLTLCIAVSFCLTQAIWNRILSKTIQLRNMAILHFTTLVNESHVDRNWGHKTQAIWNMIQSKTFSWGILPYCIYTTLGNKSHVERTWGHKTEAIWNRIQLKTTLTWSLTCLQWGVSAKLSWQRTNQCEIILVNFGLLNQYGQWCLWNTWMTTKDVNVRW